MLIDSHCHLNASEFDADRLQVWQRAQKSGVSQLIILAVHPDNFSTVARLAHQVDGIFYALGIHPLYVRYCESVEVIETLGKTVQAALSDPLFIGIGEIGLDFFVPEISEGAAREQQELFYREQLKIAQTYDLPVILHVRRSQDTLLKYLRRIPVQGGIAHAFNGSMQQAQAFINLGFCLGFGGTLTYPRSWQIRRLATELDIKHLVLETDAPDMPPVWLDSDNRRNSPEFLPRIAQDLADLRGMSLSQLAQRTSENVRRVIPRMGT